MAANETGLVYFTVKNSGKGAAYNLKLYASETNGIEGLRIPSQKFIARQLSPGQSRTDSVSVSALKNLGEGMAEIQLAIGEANNYAATPARTSVRTREFSLPKLLISDVVLSEISANEIRLHATIKNTGISSVRDVNVTVKYPNAVLAKGKSSETLPLLKPDESKELYYTFAKTREFNGTFNYTFNVDVKDKTDLARDHKTASTKEIVEGGGGGGLLKADVVDTDIPRSSKVEPSANTYALIIGNEAYQKTSPVPHAINDARVFRDYCRLTYNIPSSNIKFVTNATGAHMQEGIRWISGKAQEAEGGNAELLIYYSGHGTTGEDRTNPSENDQYLVPVDVSNLDAGLSISRNDIYASLSKVSFKRASIFLDACYDGTHRGMDKTPKYNWKGKIFVFASSSFNQVSNPYSEKRHGFFTYFLLKSLWETKGNINYETLVEQVKRQVSLQSKIVAGKAQIPEAIPSPETKDDWKRWKICN